MAQLLRTASGDSASLRQRFEAGEIVIFSLTVLLSATAAIRSALARIRADGTPIDLLPSLPPFEEFLDFIGMPEIRELEQRFAEG